jgi:hypothetical protein
VPVKQSGEARDPELIDRYEDGIGWLAYPEEGMQRASHALRASGEVYLVDPLDVPELESVLEDLGPVAGIVVLLARHQRDAVRIARRLEVPIHLPAWVDIDEAGDVPIERHTDTLAGTDFAIEQIVDWPGWREAVLYDGETLVVPEAVGTGPFFLAPGERLGVQSVLRLTPPRALRQFDPERILVGHGRGIHTDASAALADALDGSRRNAPGVWLDALRSMIG